MNVSQEISRVQRVRTDIVGGVPGIDNLERMTALVVQEADGSAESWSFCRKLEDLQGAGGSAGSLWFCRELVVL